MSRVQNPVRCSRVNAKKAEPPKTPTVVNFIKRQEPGTEYILTVCTGSWILSKTGLLSGRKATTNKLFFNHVKEDTKDLNITWIPKARYVVDGKYWTSSGVTAGMSQRNGSKRKCRLNEYQFLGRHGHGKRVHDPHHKCRVGC